MSYLAKDDLKEKESEKEKILFLGLTQTGKTSIMKTFFEGMKPEETKSLDATIKYDRNFYKVNHHQLEIYDVGGQISYLEEMVEKNKEMIFSNVKILIYVIDLPNLDTYRLSRQYLMRILKYVNLYSKNPKIYLFTHKMDLISEGYRERAIQIFRKYFEKVKLEKIKIFQTSIYESTSRKAMKEIFYL